MNRSAVEEIKARLSIEEIVGSYVKLEKAGKSFKAKCPFHNEKTASFFVSPDRGGYYCFGCGVKGDTFSFVEQFEGLDFKGALKILAEKAGVPLVFDQKVNDERDTLYSVMEEATKYFQSQLEKSKEAQNYVTGRGISVETQKAFRLGWAPEGWRNLSAYLKGKGWSDAVMEKAGLIKKREQDDGNRASNSRVDTSRSDARGASDLGSRSESVGEENEKRSTSGNTGGSNFYDRFRGRIMFPISDSSGRVVAFSGRILKEDANSAKYLNSPDTPLYDKAMILYGLDKAKSDIRRIGYTILVEGQMDLIMSHQAGIKNTVAASGTALTDDAFNENGAVSNLGLVRRLSPNIIVAFDSDSAGRKAAMRAAGIALAMGMDVKVADIVGGKDPADLVKEGAESWKNVLRAAKPIVEFELMNVLRDTPDPRKVPRALRDRVFPFLARIESSMDKAHFVKMIADKAKITEDAVWEDLRKVQNEKAKEAKGDILTPTNITSKQDLEAMHGHLDLVERRIFGLLTLMEKENKDQANAFRIQLKEISGTSYDDRVNRSVSRLGDLTFEAEAFFGNDRAHWDAHMRELLLNFKLDLINEELVTAMQELKVAERDGDTKRLGELVAKCQALSMRKAEVGKKRRV